MGPNSVSWFQHLADRGKISRFVRKNEQLRDQPLQRMTRRKKPENIEKKRGEKKKLRRKEINILTVVRIERESREL